MNPATLHDGGWPQPTERQAAEPTRCRADVTLSTGRIVKHSRIPVWSCDAATGDLYERGECVGKLVTGASGAWFRLIESGNAYAGMTDPAAEIAALRSKADDHPKFSRLVASQQAEIAVLKVERDALRAALELSVGVICEPMCPQYKIGAALDQARAALAKGGAK